MTLIVDKLGPSDTYWSHPLPGYRLTTTARVVRGSGTGETSGPGGGAACAFDTAPSIETGNVSVQVGAGSPAYQGSNSVFDLSYGPNYLLAVGGQQNYGYGGRASDCLGTTITGAFNGGNGVDTSGGGSAGPGGPGQDGVGSIGGDGGDAGSFPSQLAGGKGGDQGNPGIEGSGAGIGNGDAGGDGMVAVLWDLVASTATLTFPDDSTQEISTDDNGSDIEVDYTGATSDVPLLVLTPAGNPQPQFALLSNQDHALFEIFDSSDFGDGSEYIFRSMGNLDPGTYHVDLDFAGMKTIEAGGEHATLHVAVVISGTDPGPPPPIPHSVETRIGTGIGIGV